MNNWKQKLALLMQGRHGPDALYKALIAVYFALFIVNLFVSSGLLSLAALLLPVIAFYRAFSKDTAKRTAENRQYLQMKDRLIKSFKQLKSRWTERKTHRYRKCPNCHTTLRLQKKIGTMQVTCPICHTQFSIIINH